jgi:hypothetical protein
MTCAIDTFREILDPVSYRPDDRESRRWGGKNSGYAAAVA